MIFYGNIVEITEVVSDITLKEIIELFHKFGKIRAASIENGPSGTSVILQYDNPLDAKDTIKARDGYEYRGLRMQLRLK